MACDVLDWPQVFEFLGVHAPSHHRRGDQRVGFLLEYDRGTERARRYDAKLADYYTYRCCGKAARDYGGFPRVLFVTATGAAEARFIAAVERAAARNGHEGFSFLTTTTAQIEHSGPSFIEYLC